MSRLVWDQTGKRKYENGVSNAVLYTPWGVDIDGEDHENDMFNFADGLKRVVPDGQPYYFGCVWNGITSISESPDGADPNDMWADNMKYSSLRSKETYGLTIEAYTYPDEFAACDGTGTPQNGVKLGQQKRLPFALAYKTNIGSDSSSGTDGYLLHLVYNCTASPTDRAYETINDSPDAITFSWEVDSNPVKFDDPDLSGFSPVSSIIIDSTKISDSNRSVTIGSKTYCGDTIGLSRLESILFGTDETAPVMPSPDFVLECFRGIPEEPEDEGDIPDPGFLDPEISG